MTLYNVVIRASQLGSIGEKYNIKRCYEIEADNEDDLRAKAIARAHREELEHVLIVGTPFPIKPQTPTKS